MKDDLRYQFYPAPRLLEVVGNHDSILRPSRNASLYPNLARRWCDIRAGRQRWVSVLLTDQILTLCGHHLWEMEMEPLSVSQSVLSGKRQKAAA